MVEMWQTDAKNTFIVSKGTRLMPVVGLLWTLKMEKCNKTHADAVVGRGNTDVGNVIYGLIDPLAWQGLWQC